jgi:hypothetical protein
MSRRHDLQDGRGVQLASTGTSGPGSDFVTADTTPTNTAKGFNPGCLWQNRKGTAGSVLYVNQGTFASATWLNLG